VVALDDIELKVCRRRDLRQVLIVEKGCFSCQPYNKLDFAWMLVRARAGFVVAWANNSIVGYVIAFSRPWGNGVIQSIGVLPEYRGRGIGQTLMKHAMNHLAWCKTVNLLVEEDNKAAMRLYRSFGFRENGKVIKGYYCGKNAMEFVKDRLSGSSN
jgi:[ribosomal protein S18]-alanine N-acetyltransferase